MTMPHLDMSSIKFAPHYTATRLDMLRFGNLSLESGTSCCHPRLIDHIKLVANGCKHESTLTRTRFLPQAPEFTENPVSSIREEYV